MIPFVWFALLLFVFILCVILYGRKTYGILDNCGFPVIPTTFFLGSDPFFYKHVQHFQQIEQSKRYGPIWGMYWGKYPKVFVADPELTRLILVKDFEYFCNRPDANFGSDMVNQILGYLPYKKWKAIRPMLSPIFSTGKLKAMVGVMSAHAQELVEDLKIEGQYTKGRVKFDCKRFLNETFIQRRLTSWLIDLFTQCTLGIKLENRKDPDNEFALAFRKMFGEGIEYGLLYSLTMTFPFLAAFAPTCDDSPSKLIESTIRHILDSRRHRVDAKAADFVDALNDVRGKVDSEEFQKLGISEQIVIYQTVGFFLGGYDTSSTTITHLLYYLAKYPQIQDQLYQEIVSKFGRTLPVVVEHENLRDENMPFLTACLKETVRLVPPFNPDRVCTKDWKHGNIRIKKGANVYISVWALQRNPEYFPNPDEFKPERFLPENKANINPYAFAAFGHGPRVCIGMRFAYDSLKTFFIHFLHQFKVELRADTVLNYKKGATFLVGVAPLHLDIVQRAME